MHVPVLEQKINTRVPVAWRIEVEVPSLAAVSQEVELCQGSDLSFFGKGKRERDVGRGGRGGGETQRQAKKSRRPQLSEIN